jgi:hypothetical protein
MIDTVTDTQNLYDTNADFRNGIAEWVAERRCPLPLVDLLIENGMETAAECCRWAATEPERRVWSPYDRKLSGPFPTLSVEKGYWYWAVEEKWTLYFCDNIPSQLLRSDRKKQKPYNRPEQSLLWLMESWK